MSNTNLPAFNVFTVIDRGRNRKAFWLKIGAAWPHESGKGFNVNLDALPIDGKIGRVSRRFE
jgi:hypothetical protein